MAMSEGQGDGELARRCNAWDNNELPLLYIIYIELFGVLLIFCYLYYIEKIKNLLEISVFTGIVNAVQHFKAR